ncbi:MAG: hypothetical protein IJE43_17655 [Alphaproteobacteria bacterium]|nr:hypothetical protein [Alphaproteobacteria bacterium]MBQ3515349.1 hypothetical protein [Lachnospiraceae bacterium]
MSRARKEVEQLEEMVVSGRKKFVRYAEGAQFIVNCFENGRYSVLVDV